MQTITLILEAPDGFSQRSWANLIHEVSFHAKEFDIVFKGSTDSMELSRKFTVTVGHNSPTLLEDFRIKVLRVVELYQQLPTTWIKGEQIF